MKSTGEAITGMRSIIVWTLAVIIGIAIAPWLSGGEEPIARLITAMALLLGAIFVWREARVKHFAHGPLAWSYFGFTAWSALSYVWSINRYSSMLWILTLVLAGLVFRLANIVAAEREGKERLVKVYVVSALIFCGYGIYLYLTSDYDRLTGSFYWANPASAYLMPAILIGISRLGGKRRRAAGWIAVTTIFGASFLLTESRGGTLVLGILLLIYILTRRAKLAYWIHILFTVVAVILLSIGLTQARHHLHPHATTTAIGSRFAEAASGESQSSSDRLHYLQSAVSIWMDKPVLGSGAGTYGDIHPNYQKTVVSASTSAHNIYVQLLAELGLIGMLLLLWMLVALAIGLLRSGLNNHHNVPIILGIVALLMHFGLDIDAHYPSLVLLLAALIGMVYFQRPHEPRRASWQLMVLAAITLVPLISLYQSDAWVARAKAAQDDGDYQAASFDYQGAHRGLLFNPDIVEAEGIDYYTQATLNPAASKDLIALALDRARTAERLDPSDGQHHQLEGRVLSLQGKKAEAVAAFKQALTLDPHNHPDYAYDLATAQLQAGDNASALTTLNTMLAQYTSAVVDNRNEDATLRPTLASLAALAGNIEVVNHDLDSASRYARQASTYYSKSIQAQGLTNLIARLRAAAPAE